MHANNYLCTTIDIFCLCMFVESFDTRDMFHDGVKTTLKKALNSFTSQFTTF